MTTDAPQDALVLTRRAAAAEGLGDGHLRRLVASRTLTRIRRGSYLDSRSLAALQREERHRLAVTAAVGAQETSGLVSHVSAAVLWGLPVWGVDLSVVHLTKRRRNAGRRNRLVHLHTTPTGDDECAVLDGTRVTSVARTVVDLACLAGFESGVIAADAALHDGMITGGQLAEVVSRARGRPGSGAARAVVAFADGRSESVGESRSRVGMQRAGVPAPDLQSDIVAPDGTFVGRPDFRWGRLLGEFDGLVKYGRLLRSGESPGDAVVREKRREDAMRELGFDVVRWGWSDLATPRVLYPRLLAALARVDARTR